MNPGFRSSASILGGLSAPDRAQLRTALGAASDSTEALADALLNPERIAESIRHASQDALTALKTWVLESGLWRDFLRRGRVDHGIQELIELGWVFETYYGPHRRLYLMPWELMPRVVPLLWDIPWDRITGPGPARESTPAPVWTPIIHDMFQLLAFARHEPLLLTNQRDVYRRLKNKLDQLIWPRPEIAASAVVDRLLEALDHMRLFETADGPFRYDVSDLAEQLWMKGPNRVFQTLGDFLFDPSRLAWPTLLWASLASHIPAGATLNVSHTLDWMTAAGFPHVRNSYLFNQARQDMVVFDFWDLGSRETGRLTDWAYSAMNNQFEAAENAASLIQPTGDILVPPQAPLRERWQIDEIATRIQSDRVSTYRIDQRAVREGVRRGWNAEIHRDALERLTRNPLPDNIRINLEDWYRLIGRHRLMEVTIVHSVRPEDSRDVETLLGDEVVSRLSPTDIVIRHDRVKAVAKKLDRAGAPILSEILRPSHPENTADGPLVPKRAVVEWPVRLPADDPPVDDNEDVRQVVMGAARHGLPLQLVFQMPGESVARSESVVAITVENQWVQVYVVSQHRYLLIDWKQILAAGPVDGPV